MVEELKMELKYFQTFWRQYQWFLLYEFEIANTKFFEQSDKQIIEKLVNSPILNRNLYHPEMDGTDLEVAVQNLYRPYNFDKIELNDFELLSGQSDFYDWLTKFKTEGWKDDREDAHILIEQAEEELKSRTNFDNGVWFLSKENFDRDLEKLDEINWIYLHFETFIEIDRANRIIRSFDFGYD